MNDAKPPKPPNPPPPWGWTPSPAPPPAAPKKKNDHGRATQTERTARYRAKKATERNAKAIAETGLPAVIRKPRPTQWKPGQSGNPRGVQGATLYKEAQRIARDASPDAARRLIALMDDPDTRVAYMAADKLMERAWGKPKEYDPATDPENRVRIDVSKLTDAERGVLRQLIKIATTVGGQAESEEEQH